MKTRYKILIIIITIITLLFLIFLSLPPFHKLPDCASIYGGPYNFPDCTRYDDDLLTIFFDRIHERLGYVGFGENEKTEPVKIKVTRQPGFVVIPDYISVPLPFVTDPERYAESQELWILANGNGSDIVYNEEGKINLDLMLKQLHEYCEINYLPACKDLHIINLNGSSRNEN